MKTAVVFIIFRRPDTTRQVFARIRQARPPKLYIVADGLWQAARQHFKQHLLRLCR